MADNPAKGCVFCGEKPESKTKEHVLPQWLIELTGDSKRIINVGGIENPKKFSINSFHFPACDDCNNYFADLEVKAKTVFLKLFDEEPLTGDDCETLLDWFDKIRIGMWLAGLNLHGNKLGISPKFYISTRIARHDRLLYIGQMSTTTNKLHFSEVDEYFFQCIPGVFALRVNSLWFVTASGVGIAAGSLGLPYPKSAVVNDGLGVYDFKTKIKPGWRLNWPTAPKNFTLLVQAIYSIQSEIDSEPNLLEELNNTQFEDILQEGKRKSFVYMLQNNELIKVDEAPVKITPYIYDKIDCMADKIFQICKKLRCYLAKGVFISKENRKTAFAMMLRYVKKTGNFVPVPYVDKMKENSKK